MREKILDVLPPRIYLELKHREFKRVHRAEYNRMQGLRKTETGDGYSYKPFDDTRSIFVHVPKCAGVSVCRAIFGNLAGGHKTLDSYLNIFEPKCVLNYFKFTIVRNPWDRLVSAYFFLRNGGLNNRDKAWFNRELGSIRGFDDFVKQWLNRSNIWKWHHFRPQYHYILEKRGKIRLDFVGFVENLDADFKYIVDRIDTKGVLPISNVSRHASYLHYYNREMRDLVADVYSEDIEMLGYNFDNSSLPQQLARRDAGAGYSLRNIKSMTSALELHPHESVQY